MSTLKIFGIRHHGPGSAQSLRNALATYSPDCILIEGPPEADALLTHVADAGMKPPIALLLYAKDTPKHASFYPFAAFSPEWQALQYGVEQNVKTQFMDLPVAFRFAADLAESAEEPAKTEEPSAEDVDPLAPTEAPVPTVRQDPLSWLAHAAGYTDGERWWEQLVEERGADEDVFAAIFEAMSALREVADADMPPEIWEQRREAYMRKTIRAARKQGFARIAVVCGAWHAPVLQLDSGNAPKIQDDNALLKGLPKAKVAATWIPWTTSRLSRASGYGAGINSPGWYSHLWRYQDSGNLTLASRWLTRVARLLRAEGLDASSAQVIDGVRLAQTLSAMRGRATIGIDALDEAAYAVFANGNPKVLQLISAKLTIGNRLGTVSSAVPTTPLQKDVAASQKRLRMQVSATHKELVLDLRKPNDLARSQLLHRLRLLNIHWGATQQSRGKGTFKETWMLGWQPEFEVQVIEAGRYGQTLAQASGAFVVEKSNAAQNLAELTALLDDTLLADLPDATELLVQRIRDRAAQDADVQHLMQALPSLAHVLRYGNVRTQHQADVAALETVVNGIFTRICIGLPNACRSIADDAAETLFLHLQQIHSAVKLLQNEQHLVQWLATLDQLCAIDSVHALLQGRATKILFDEAQRTSPEVAHQLGLALSDPEITRVTAWLDGFFKNSGILLMHDDVLFDVLDSWFETISEDKFQHALPLIRRTFSSFETGERHNIGRKASGQQRKTQQPKFELDPTRGQRVLDHIAVLLGQMPAATEVA